MLKRWWRKILVAAAVLAPVAALAGGVPLVPSTSQYSEASQIIGTLNFVIGMINTAITPQTMAPLNTPRNLLDNGATNIQQRGTGTATAGTTSGCAISSYAADRWCMDVNVTSGAGQLTPITSTPTPPIGFQNALKVVRNSGALLQPQCVWQEVPTSSVVQLQGQNAVFSATIQALAGLAGDQGSTTQTANLVIITGTGTDQGLGVLRSAVGMTASPAITPAWTGIATLVNASVALPVTPVWTRYSATGAVATTVTEMAVGICFTPTATGAGTTDGIAFTGAQLEQGALPSIFENKPAVIETLQAQRYFEILTEPAAGVQVPVTGNSTSATAAAMVYEFPVLMAVAPTFTALGSALSATTWTNKCGNVNNVLATTFIVTATANLTAGASLTVTSTGSTIGFGCVLVGAGGGSILSWSADF